MKISLPAHELISLNRVQPDILQEQQDQEDVSIPIGPLGLSFPPPQPENKLPSRQLIQGISDDHIDINIPLCEASIKGDWNTAEAIFKERPELVRSAITKNFETPLHIAASALSNKTGEHFIRNLVYRMDTEDLLLQDRCFNTAFSIVATTGNVEVANIMLAKNETLLNIPGAEGKMPLEVATLSEKANMVRHLYYSSKEMSPRIWTNEKVSWVLQKCVHADIFDVAKHIVNNCTQLTFTKKILEDIVLVLAEKAYAFEQKEPHMTVRIIKSLFHMNARHGETESDALILFKILWDKIVKMANVEFDGETKTDALQYPSQVLFLAAKTGNLKVTIKLLQSYPDLILLKDEQGLIIFHLAVKHRQENIYNLLYDIGSLKVSIITMVDNYGNNMLHLAAGGTAQQKQFQDVPGVALQMHAELLWFMEVEQMIPPTFRQMKNKDDKIPHEIFTEKHSGLIIQGEDWMKDAAPHYMVAAALVATIAFAGAFAIPGGYDQNTGLPMFGRKAVLTVFVLADAISLILSSTSILMFLSIMTSRYARRERLHLLPKKVMFFLTTLFLSILAITIAFCAGIFILYDKKFAWVPITVTSLSAIPVIVFVILEVRYLGDVTFSIYRLSNLFKPKKRMLYQ